MAVAIHDAVVLGIQTNGTIALTIAFTVTAGINLAIIVRVGVDAAADRNPVCTWNGTSVPLIPGGEVLGSSTAQPCAIFALANPATGTHNVVVDTDKVSSTDYILADVMTLENVDQTTIADDIETGSGGSATTRTEDITVSSGGMAIDAVVVNGNPTITPGASPQTQQTNTNDGSGSGGTMFGTSYATSGTPVTMVWTFASSSRTSQVACNIRQAGGAPAAPVGKLVFARQAVNRASTY